MNKRDIRDLTVATAVGIVLLFVLMTVFTFGVGGWIRATAGWSGKTSQINKTKGSGDYRIASYDHFFDLCASVQDQEVTIAAQKEELKTATGDRVSQIHANLSALTANRNEQINHYNADARKSGTQGQFKDSSLPYQLDPTQEKTTCTV